MCQAMWENVEHFVFLKELKIIFYITPNMYEV